MNKKFVSILFLLAFMLMLCTSCVSNNSGGEASSNSSGIENEVDPNAEIIVQPEGRGITFAEEEDGAEIKKIKTDPSKFFGTWEATSDKAAYLYGNVDLTVKEDGTWNADITGDKLEGKWEEKGDYLHLSSDVFSFDLAYETSGKLMMIETTSDGVIYSVLTKK